jgi:hypothetical protein
MKKISVSEILSFFVFLPPAKTMIIKVVRQVVGGLFRSVGKLLNILL